MFQVDSYQLHLLIPAFWKQTFLLLDQAREEEGYEHYLEANLDHLSKTETDKI